MSLDWIPFEPARKITPKEQGNRGLIPSNKVIGGIMEYESCLERDFFLLCDHSPSVKTFQHQPVTIKYKDFKGKTRKYTPDAYVEFKNGKKGLYEVKYEDEVLNNSEKYEKRWDEAKKWANIRGVHFAVLTERDIRTPRQFNIWLTLGASKCPSNSDYVQSLNLVIPDEGERYNQLCYTLAETLGIEIGKSAQIICYAIYHGLVFVDTFSTKQLSKNTIIRKKKKDNSSPFKPLLAELHSDTEANAPIKESDIMEEITLKSVDSKIPVKYEKQVSEREKIVQLWIRQPSAKRTPEWREEFCNKWETSEKTIYRWVEAYEKNGQEGLVPKHNRAGRPKKYDKTTIECMEDARKYYLKPRGTLKKAYRKLEALCNEKNVPVPPKPSFQRYIYANTTASELGKKRGKKYYKSHFTPSLASFQGAFMPMQILQMDNTGFDVFPVDSEEREQLGTPYMTGAIDCYTRIMTGFSVSFHPSSARTVLEVLVQSILPKDNYVDSYETEQDWEIQGFPVVILVDNGMDYRSNAVKEFCIKYDIIIEFAPIRTPRYKAFIEQWFNILRNALEDEDVPATRPLLKYRLENPDLKPELDAVLTLQAIEMWLHKWVLDEYHFTNPYDDHQPAPYLRWKDFQDGRTNLILPSPRESPQQKNAIEGLHLATLERFERTLRSDGVVWEHLKYNNVQLSKIYDIIGKRKVTVLLDTRDVRNLWVVNPITENSTIKVGWAKTITSLHDNKPINASAWINEVRLLRRIYKSRITPYIYQKEISRKKRQQLLKTSKKESKKVRKQKEKARETTRKSITKKLQPKIDSIIPQEKPHEHEKYDGTEQIKKEIDWAQIKFAGKRKRKPF
ncbi:MAG: DDE-type integrase/transposase/recombinase [Candidatus Helarchaeota archaeon]|nr:DDE-type integrase/transposase/recombinase [Candidatus Helarchaeota archaeon]